MSNEKNTDTVHVEYRTAAKGDIAVLTIDFPPVNAGSTAMRTALMAALEGLDPARLAGVVLTGAGGNFVGGADIREFDAPAVPPHLPDVLAKIEDLPVPVVAAMEGAALGGGYELALGCDARVAAPRAVVGLPEATLGLIPGSGGGVRVSRLVGEVRAIELVTSGRRVKSAEALELGMIDAIAEGDVVEAAIAHLETMNGQKRILRDLPARPGEPEAVEAAKAAALKKGRGSLAVAEAIDAVRQAQTLPVGEALAAERETSLRIRRGPQSRALRHLFFAERAATKLPEGVEPGKVETVGIVGGGRMGQGIALAFAQAGLTVRIAERDATFMANAMKALEAAAEDLAARGRIGSAQGLMERLLPGELEAMADCDLVVEAIIEDMDAKKTLFRQLDQILSDDAILATNTSYLDIDEIAAATKLPGRVAGLHFFNPANVMRLVEVIDADATTPEVLATLVALAKRIRKLPVVAKVGEGFIGNRVFAAYRQQAEFLIEEGALPWEVDAAIEGFGFAMGFFKVYDLAGLDIAWARRKRLAPTRDPKARYVEIPDVLCEMERFGRKTGSGWYDYASGKPVPDPKTEEVIANEMARKGIEARQFTADEIVSRIMAAIVNEAALLLGEGIAARASDVDIVLVNGYGFPKLKGGPLHWAAAQPREAFLASVAAMAEASGHGIEPAANLEAVLKEAEEL